MRKPTKTMRVITWPDGRREELKRGGIGWTWHADMAQSSHLENAVLNIVVDGGTVTVEPNPRYAAQLRAWENSELRRMFRPFFDF